MLELTLLLDIYIYEESTGNPKVTGIDELEHLLGVDEALLQLHVVRAQVVLV